MNSIIRIAETDVTAIWAVEKIFCFWTGSVDLTDDTQFPLMN